MPPSTSPPRFEPTKWTLIARLAGPEAAAREALNELCRVYWHPLYCFARQSGLSHEDAQDDTQEFLANAVDSNLFGRADHNRGHLRTLLLTAFRQFLLNEAAYRRAKKRGGGAQVLSLDSTTARDSSNPALVTGETPEDVYVRAWARAVLNRVMLRLEEKWTNDGKAEWFACLKPFLSGARGGEETYEEAGQRLGTSPGRVRLSAFRLRRSYREELLREIRETVASDDPLVLEDELNFLIRAVG